MQTYTRGNHRLACNISHNTPVVRDLCNTVGMPRGSYRQLDTTRGHQRILQVPTKNKKQK